MNFTPKQLNLINYIREYNVTHGFSPTLTEIAEHFKVSTVTVFGHLEALERKGVIKRRRYEARSIELIDNRFIENGVQYEYIGEGIIEETGEKAVVLKTILDNKIIMRKEYNYDINIKRAATNFTAVQMAGTIRMMTDAQVIIKQKIEETTKRIRELETEITILKASEAKLVESADKDVLPIEAQAESQAVQRHS